MWPTGNAKLRCGLKVHTVWAPDVDGVLLNLCETQKWVKLMQETHSGIWAEKCLEEHLRALRLRVWAYKNPNVDSVICELYETQIG